VPGRAYDVVVGSDLLAHVGSLLPDLPAADAGFVVMDGGLPTSVCTALLDGIRTSGLRVVSISVAAGEAAKSLRTYEAVVHQLASQEAHRSDVVFALGGGAVGDVAGFVASTYMRGMPIVQVPTTLAGQVDAAVGGKTAVNLPEGKNLVGTFHQPIAVIADVTTLATLPDRHYRTGLAEVAKYGLALDVELLARLEDDPGSILARDPEALETLVARCVAAKARTVVADERDAGTRLILNYGHTLGHAIERLDAFAGRTHGQAIAIGMVFAARLAEARGIAEPGLAARTQRLLKALGLETAGPLPPVREVVDAFRLDKKFHGGVRFVLLEDVGKPIVVDDVAPDDVRDVLIQMGAAA
jgi:3-dehydroquinate synthase